MSYPIEKTLAGLVESQLETAARNIKLGIKISLTRLVMACGKKGLKVVNFIATWRLGCTRKNMFYEALVYFSFLGCYSVYHLNLLFINYLYLNLSYDF